MRSSQSHRNPTTTANNSSSNDRCKKLHRYAVLLLFLAAIHLVAIVYVLSKATHQQTEQLLLTTRRRWIGARSACNYSARQSSSVSLEEPFQRTTNTKNVVPDPTTSATTQAPLQPSLALEHQKQPQQHRSTFISSIRVVTGGSGRKGDHNNNGDELIHRLSPRNLAKADATLQLDDRTVVVVGGFTDTYQSVTPCLQFFDIPSQQWYGRPLIRLPKQNWNVAETHQGIAYDRTRRILYIVSGQKGRGCSPATPTVVRYRIEDNKWEQLPPLPAARYSPGVELVVADPKTENPNRSYLHVFGGAGENRKTGAMDHWRLTIMEDGDRQDGRNASTTTANNRRGQWGEWEVMESLPDAGVHGTSFLSSDGYIHYTAYCQLDQGVLRQSSSMAVCHQHAVDIDGQRLHHVSDVGLTFRYPIAWSDPSQTPHWERVTDMPFPTCHGGSWFDSSTDTLYYMGGGLTNTQIKQGSAPKSLSMIQTYNANTTEWRVYPFEQVPRGSHLFSLLTWMDTGRNILYSLHPGTTVIAATMSLTATDDYPELNVNWTKLATSYLDRTRAVSIVAFQRCLQNANATTDLNLYTATDKDGGRLYEDNRGTWNEQNRALQYPDIIAYPKDEAQVSSLVNCARSTGYRLCSRNGRHSYDGSSSCSRGVVVDMSRMDSWEVVALPSTRSATVVRLGSGMTLGKVAIALQSIGLALPSGSCATVGVTGLTLSGGQGPLSRLHGLTCDHLVAIDLVDNTGHLIHARDDNEFSDYLWLARGGGTVGHHFPGIITQLYYDDLVPTIGTRRIESGVGDLNSTIWTRARMRFPSNTTVAVELLQSWHKSLMEERAQANENSLARRVTIEPWLLFERSKRNLRKVARPKIQQIGNETFWDGHVFVNVYFFGSQELHSDYFVPQVLRAIQFNWTSVIGHVAALERLDHLSFVRKLGGVRSNTKLASGIHGHDTNHERWRGYSAIVKDPMSQNSQGLDRVFKKLVDLIFSSEPKYRRYAEFKPFGGAISSTSAPNGAFGHRDAAWMVLVNHFLDNSTKDLEPGILSESQSRHDEITGLMRKTGWYNGMYPGYLQHTDRMHFDLEEYYGDHAVQIDAIKRRRDPSNLFRRWLPNSRPTLFSTPNESISVSQHYL